MEWFGTLWSLIPYLPPVAVIGLLGWFIRAVNISSRIGTPQYKQDLLTSPTAFLECLQDWAPKALLALGETGDPLARLLIRFRMKSDPKTTELFLHELQRMGENHATRVRGYLEDDRTDSTAKIAEDKPGELPPASEAPPKEA